MIYCSEPSHLADLASDWAHREVDAQKLGDQWLDSMAEALLIVPSVIVPPSNASHRNVLIDHRHPGASGSSE